MLLLHLRKHWRLFAVVLSEQHVPEGWGTQKAASRWQGRRRCGGADGDHLLHGVAGPSPWIRDDQVDSAGARDLHLRTRTALRAPGGKLHVPPPIILDEPVPGTNLHRPSLGLVHEARSEHRAAVVKDLRAGATGEPAWRHLVQAQAGTDTDVRQGPATALRQHDRKLCGRLPCPRETDEAPGAHPHAQPVLVFDLHGVVHLRDAHVQGVAVEQDLGETAHLTLRPAGPQPWLQWRPIWAWHHLLAQAYGAGWRRALVTGMRDPRGVPARRHGAAGDACELSSVRSAGPIAGQAQVVLELIRWWRAPDADAPEVLCEDLVQPRKLSRRGTLMRSDVRARHAHDLVLRLPSPDFIVCGCDDEANV
mmetsp:Transcript_56781/g.182414  ORF Transcript_56781/g.182414 Transcript_56781/m.182414 type:complete len:364 (-) Transcript_56781:307-1398(-)